MTLPKTAYLAGPMTGKPYYNAYEFDKAARAWRKQGVTVTTPFDANSIAWRRVHNRDFDPYVDKCDWGDPILNDMLAEDFKALLRSDAVAVLEGWRHSKGTRTEVLVALNVGKPIYDAVTFQRLDLVPHLQYEGGVAA